MHGYFEIRGILWVILKMTNMLALQYHLESDCEMGQWD